MSALKYDNDRFRAIALAAVMLVAAVSVGGAVASMGVVGLGAASDASASDDDALENLTLDADPADANAASTHTWSFDDADFDGEVDEITVRYPDGTSLDGLTNDDVTVTMVRQLSDGLDESEIRVNSDEYAGTEATFDLSGTFNTDLVGSGSVVVHGVENPDSGEYAPTITFTGDDDEVTATADLVVNGGGDGDEGDDGDEGGDDGPAEGASLTLDPAVENAASTHTWEFDDIDFDGEVDEIVATYPEGTSFDGLTNDDVTVALTRSGESEPTDIDVNSDEYAGTEATFDLSGVFNTDIDGESAVTIDGVENPTAGEYGPTLTFIGDDDTVTVSAAMTVDETDTLTATLTDAEGDPLTETEALLTLDGADDATDGQAVVTLVTTDANGTAVVEVPAAGTYDVTATAQGAGEATETVEIDGETTATLTLSPGETGTLDALVTDAEGDPLAEGTWVRIDGDDLTAPRTGQVDGDGVLLIEGVEPGEYALTAETTANGTTDAVSVTVVAGETATTEFTYGDAQTTADLAGTVTDTDGHMMSVAAGGVTSGVEISYAADDSFGNGPPSSTPGEGPSGSGPSLVAPAA